MWALVEARAAASPDVVALMDGDDREVTFAELRDRTERVAAGLHAEGISHGTRVTWQLPTRIESIVLSFALARLGTTQLPIIPIYREREVGSVLVQGGVRFFVDGTRTSSVIMQNDPHRIRFVDSIHLPAAGDIKIRF